MLFRSAIERIQIEICKLWEAIADINKHQSQVEPHAEPIASEGSAEWAWQMLKQNYILVGTYWGDDVIVSSGGQLDCEVIPIKAFRKRKGTPITEQDFISHAEANGWQIHEPEPEFKVGDWVEFNPGNNPKQVEIVEVDGDNLYYNIMYAGVMIKAHIYASAIIRKLSPFDVEVDFGFAKGRILSRMSGDVKVLNNKSVVIASIIVSEITNPTTRSLVESLLKAQKGGE